MTTDDLARADLLDAKATADAVAGRSSRLVRSLTV